MPQIPAPFREPSEAERMLLVQLAARWPDGPPNWVSQIRVRELNDGGMGSLRLVVSGASSENQVFGRRAAEYEFADMDGVTVIASLNLDQDGLPFELDVWKVDFTPTARLARPNAQE